MSGLVSLVGAGPGDPGLITVKGLRRLREADVVVHDRLAPAALLDEVRPDARRVDVGKAPGRAEMSQNEINSLLVHEGRAGHRVVRLKGGDPFVFGRGGEEAAALAAAEVAFEVVPGITSAVAAPAYAGIPVTHRGLATHVTFVTGHEDPKKGESQTDWEALAGAGGTLAILMGVGRIGEIVDRLLAGGRNSFEPVAAITWGTTPRQTVVRTTLAELPSAGVEGPAVIVVGPVAALSDDLSWFVPGPLTGRTVVVTRARERASELRARLEELGALVIELPSIAFTSPSDPARMVRAIADLADGAYSWVVFTSSTGVERTFLALEQGGLDARAFGGTRIGAIGPGTHSALAERGLVPDVIPDEFVAEALAAAMPSGIGRLLLLRAEEAREVLPEVLSQKGWLVDVVPVYRTVLGDGDDAATDALARGEVDAVTFTASSTVRNFVELVGDVPRPPMVACIGPITATTAEELGWPPTVVAEEHTIEGLVRALVSAIMGP